MKRKFKNGKRLIRRICGCGDCGKITNYGKKYVGGHNRHKHTEESKEKMRKPRSEEAKKNMSLARIGNTSGRGLRSKEAKLNISIGHIKPHPEDEYCDTWRDREYKKDIRKDYCENANCKGHYKRLSNHHIWLDKKRCAPKDIMTLCNSCHIILHRMLESELHISANPKDFIIINRPDHVSYINKSTRKIIRIEKIKL